MVEHDLSCEISSFIDKVPFFKNNERKVKAVYPTLTEGFEFSETFRAPVIEVVTDLIMTAMQDETEYNLKLVRRAVQRFYEGRKRLSVTSTEKKEKWNRQKKLRSRRERLYNMRRKYARGEEWIS